MYCFNCGNWIEEDDLFCGNCGAVQNKSETSTKRSKKNFILLAIAISAAVVICVLAVLILFGNFSSDDRMHDDFSVSGSTEEATDAPKDHSDRVTVYCLTQIEEGEGSVSKRRTYQYDEHGNLVRETFARARAEEVWNEEFEVYVYIQEELTDLLNNEYLYQYDEFGNITQAQYIKYEDDGNVTFHFTDYYAYEYGNSGKIVSCDYSSTHVLGYPLKYYFTYDGDRIVNVDAFSEVSSDAAINFCFDYDEEGRLSKETRTIFGTDDIVSVNNISYNGNRVKAIEYTNPANDDHSHGVHTFDYNNFKKTLTHTVNDVQYSYERVFIISNQHLYNVGYLSDAKCSYDKEGNLIKIEESNGDSWIAYTYQALELTREEAERYYRRQRMQHTYSLGWDMDYYFYYPVFYYHLIPNPIW